VGTGEVSAQPLQAHEVQAEVATRKQIRSQFNIRLIKTYEVRLHQRRMMKVSIYSICCGVFALTASASGAVAQDTVLRLPSNPTPLLASDPSLAPTGNAIRIESEQPRIHAFLVSAKPDDLPKDLPNHSQNDLPNAPQDTPLNVSAPPHPQGQGMLQPQTFHEKFMAYAITTAGPRALLGPLFPAALRMADPPDHFPAEWRQGASAFGRNYGDQLAMFATVQTTRFAFGAVLREDLRYHPSTSNNVFLRTGHAVAYTFVDRSDGGHARPALANFAGSAAGGYVGISYLPAGFNDIAHADQRIVVQFSRMAASNLAGEFAPDIFRFLAEHHLPRPKIPIPEWWATR
jgi:hypothetical protein